MFVSSATRELSFHCGTTNASTIATNALSSSSDSLNETRAATAAAHAALDELGHDGNPSGSVASANMLSLSLLSYYYYCCLSNSSSCDELATSVRKAFFLLHPLNEVEET